MAGRKLTPKQERFVAEYLVDLNATEAYKRAGYKGTGRTAENNASRMLGNAGVAAAIAAGNRQLLARTELTAVRVLDELAAVGFSRMTDFAAWGPEGNAWKASSDLTAAQAAAVAEVSETVTAGGGSRKIKLHNKVAALDKLARHFGLLNDPPPLEVILGILPPAIAGWLRGELARQVRVIEGPGVPGPAGGHPAAPDERPAGGAGRGGDRAGPVAGGPPDVPLAEGDAPLFPPGGQEPLHRRTGPA